MLKYYWQLRNSFLYPNQTTNLIFVSESNYQFNTISKFVDRLPISKGFLVFSQIWKDIAEYEVIAHYQLNYFDCSKIIERSTQDVLVDYVYDFKVLSCQIAR